MSFDVVIIGGGITGAGILKAASELGLSAVLLEMDTPGNKTTAISSGLIHGGLRYLPYDRQTAKLCCLEGGILKTMAPELLCRQVFLWAVYKGQRFGLDLVEALMEGYDELSVFKQGKAHVRLDREEALTVEPNLSPNGLEGAVSFDEWKVNPHELVRFNLEEARKRGAKIYVGARAVGFDFEGNRVRAVRVRYKSDNREESVEGKVIINAAGPWAERVAQMAKARSVQFRFRKGAHLIVKNCALNHGILFPEANGHYIGAYPRDGEIWIGPTDDPFDGDLDQITVTDSEVARLRQAAEQFLPHVDFENYRTVVGVRPILYQRNLFGLLSRDHKVFDHDLVEGVGGLVSIAGGKMTAYRKMAEETLEVACRKLSRSGPVARYHAAHQSRGVALVHSLTLLVFSFFRHHWRKALGKTRVGLALFKKTYDYGKQGCCD